MAAVILKRKDIADKVARFRQRFTTMHYCLPEEKARPLIAKMLGSLLKSQSNCQRKFKEVIVNVQCFISGD